MTDPIKRLPDERIAEPPRTPGANADVRISNTRDSTKVTVSTDKGAVAKGWAGWPKDNDEWKRRIKAALPWVAGAAILLASASAIKSRKDNDDVEYAVKRKAKRAGDRAGAALEGVKENAERGWFGLKRGAHEVADEAGDKVDSAKNAAARKASEARGVARDASGYLRDKAVDAKETAKDAGRWGSQKAHDAADAAKGAYRSASDTAGRAAHKVEEKVAGAGSAALATASSAEEKVGSVMKQGGEALERDGSQSRRYYRGEQLKEEQKKKWGCSIM